MPEERKSVYAKVMGVRKSVRYWRFNPFSWWNKKVDKWSENEHLDRQAEIHKERFRNLKDGYAYLFRRIFRRPPQERVQFASFKHACEFYGISDKDIKELVRVRSKQRWWCFALALIFFANASWQAVGAHLALAVVNLLICLYSIVLGVLFTIEHWRLKNRRLGGLKEWLRS